MDSFLLQADIAAQRQARVTALLLAAGAQRIQDSFIITLDVLHRLAESDDAGIAEGARDMIRALDKDR